MQGSSTIKGHWEPPLDSTFANQKTRRAASFNHSHRPVKQETGGLQLLVAPAIMCMGYELDDGLCGRRIWGANPKPILAHLILCRGACVSNHSRPWAPLQELPIGRLQRSKPTMSIPFGSQVLASSKPTVNEWFAKSVRSCLQQFFLHIASPDTCQGHVSQCNFKAYPPVAVSLWPAFGS